MNETNIYLKTKRGNDIVKLGDISKYYFPNSLQQCLESNTIFKNYRNIEEAILSDNFYILTDNSFTKKQLELILSALYRYDDINSSKESSELINKLHEMYMKRIYLNETK